MTAGESVGQKDGQKFKNNSSFSAIFSSPITKKLLIFFRFFTGHAPLKYQNCKKYWNFPILRTARKKIHNNQFPCNRPSFYGSRSQLQPPYWPQPCYAASTGEFSDNTLTRAVFLPAVVLTWFL